MQNNRVHVEGVVKRDARANEVRNGVRLLDFCLVVKAEEGPDTYVDVFAPTGASDGLNGFVREGEAIGVDGFLTFRTYTSETGRKRSGLVVQAYDAYEIEE